MKNFYTILFPIALILVGSCNESNESNKKIKDFENDISYNKDKIISLQQDNEFIQTEIDSLDDVAISLNNQLISTSQEYDNVNEFQLFRTDEEKKSQINNLQNKYSLIQNEISVIQKKIDGQKLKLQGNKNVIKELEDKNERLNNSINEIN